MLGVVLASKEALSKTIDRIGKQYGVEPALIKSTIEVESNWDVNAKRYEVHKGDASWGLMQLLLETGRWILKDNNLTISQLVAPETNITAGTKYLKYQLDRYNGNIADAIAAYNAGSAKKNAQGVYINQEYVNKVYGRYVVNKNLERFQTTPESDNTMLYATTALIGIGLVAAMSR